MNFTKQQFKTYIQYFDYSFNESIKNNFYSLNEINDISGIEHSLNELNNFKMNKNFKIYYSNDSSLITSNKIDKNLKYFIFVELGKLNDKSSIGSIYFIYDYTKDQIIKNDEKDISFFNYCINQEDLNKMSKILKSFKN